jgi:hypothetical protein
MGGTSGGIEPIELYSPPVAKKRQRSGSYTIGQNSAPDLPVGPPLGLQASRHAVAIEYLKHALLMVEKAASLSPSSSYTAIASTIQEAIQGKPIQQAKPSQPTKASQPAKTNQPTKTSQPAIEQQIQWLFNHFQKQQPTTTKQSYSQIAQKAIQLSKPTAKPTATEPTATNPTTKPTAKPTAKPPEHGQLILITDKTKSLPTVNTVEIRDQINKAVNKRAIVRIEVSRRGNIVLTTKEAVLPAKTLLEEQQTWQSVFDGWPITKASLPETWYKLVAHGVPNSSAGLDHFIEDCTADNPIQKVLGQPRWLRTPEEGSLAGSVVFAVATEAEATVCLQKGLFIAGVKARVERYREHSTTTLCNRCSRLGHSHSTCREKPRCKYCSKNHYSTSHYCKDCGSNKPCIHIPAKCSNCPGAHETGSANCPALQGLRLYRPRIRPTIPHQQTAGQLASQPISQPTSQSISQPTNQPASQLANQLTKPIRPLLVEDGPDELNSEDTTIYNT